MFTDQVERTRKPFNYVIMKLPEIITKLNADWNWDVRPLERCDVSEIDYVGTFRDASATIRREPHSLSPIIGFTSQGQLCIGVETERSSSAFLVASSRFVAMNPFPFDVILTAMRNQQSETAALAGGDADDIGVVWVDRSMYFCKLSSSATLDEELMVGYDADGLRRNVTSYGIAPVSSECITYIMQLTPNDHLSESRAIDNLNDRDIQLMRTLHGCGVSDVESALQLIANWAPVMRRATAEALSSDDCETFIRWVASKQPSGTIRSFLYSTVERAFESSSRYDAMVSAYNRDVTTRKLPDALLITRSRYRYESTVARAIDEIHQCSEPADRAFADQWRSLLDRAISAGFDRHAIEHVVEWYETNNGDGALHLPVQTALASADRFDQFVRAYSDEMRRHLGGDGYDFLHDAPDYGIVVARDVARLLKRFSKQSFVSQWQPILDRAVSVGFDQEAVERVVAWYEKRSGSSTGNVTVEEVLTSADRLESLIRVYSDEVKRRPGGASCDPLLVTSDYEAIIGQNLDVLLKDTSDVSNYKRDIQIWLDAQGLSPMFTPDTLTTWDVGRLKDVYDVIQTMTARWDAGFVFPNVTDIGARIKTTEWFDTVKHLGPDRRTTELHLPSLLPSVDEALLIATLRQVGGGASLTELRSAIIGATRDASIIDILKMARSGFWLGDDLVADIRNRGAEVALAGNRLTSIRFPMTPGQSSCTGASRTRTGGLILGTLGLATGFLINKKNER